MLSIHQNFLLNYGTLEAGWVGGWLSLILPLQISLVACEKRANWIRAELQRWVGGILEKSDLELT